MSRAKQPEAPPPPPPPPPIVVRPHGSLAKHHGGAWKVAYADFVTALMALFIVLWMMNSTQKLKDSVGGYFRDPRAYTRKLGAGPANSGEGLRIERKTAADIQKQLEQALHQMPEFQKIRDNVKFSVTGEGVRIDLLETEQGMFFVTGSPDPTDAGARLLQVLGGELAKLPNRIVIEGHTDATPFRNAAPGSGYSNWELSADRANAARRLLHRSGLEPTRVVEVRGFADQKLLDPTTPENPRNRRVSVVVKFLDPASGG